MSTQRLAVATLTLIVAALLAAAAVWLWPMATKPSPVYEMTISGRLEGDHIVVAGRTNLPDGAKIDVYAWPDFVEDIQGVEGPDHSDTLVVRDAAFGLRVPVGAWPAGLLHVTASFSVNGLVEQDPEIVEAVGPRGEALTGPNVLTDEYGVRFLTAKLDVVKE